MHKLHYVDATLVILAQFQCYIHVNYYFQLYLTFHGNSKFS